MIISDQKEFVFVHVYKTAGTSVTAALIKYANLRYRLVDDFYLTKNVIRLLGKVFHNREFKNKFFSPLQKHSSTKDIMNYMGEDRYNKCYKFTFVRNSWD